jgi:hypothetical protein
MDYSTTRWILAFNASCGMCRAISERIAQTCDGKLEVLPLTNANVERWREQALGPQAPWLPTLLRITENATDVQAWTGPAMGLRLVQRLGLQSTMQVLAALELLRRGEEERPITSREQGAIGRGQFLRLCAGGAVAAGMILVGKTPAFAAGGNKTWTEAQAWVVAHRDQLPQAYDELIAHPLVYRKAIYRASTPAVRSQFWQEHLQRYRAAHPTLSAQQEAVLNRFQDLARTNGATLSKADEQAASDAFGPGEAHAIFATLGPESTTSALRPADQVCNCTVGHDWCSDSSCHMTNCAIEGGCGVLWSYDCNGLCW